jgi:hypoxanthine-DNA glycosylase
MGEIKRGFAPFYDGNSKVLILGSFPSVKSRQVEFYYGNKQNAFWRIVSSFFGESEPLSTADKKDFLTRRNIALWDVVESCEIEGSADATIKNFTVANIESLINSTGIKTIILNGGTAAKIFDKHFKTLNVLVIKVPSTSPANTGKKEEAWNDALRRAFERAK